MQPRRPAVDLHAQGRWASTLLILAGACSGDLLEREAQTLAPAGSMAMAPAAASAAQASPVPGRQPCAGTAASSPATRFFRLTHLQYDNAIASLTGLMLNPSHAFPVDQNQAGFDRGIDLQVGEVLGQAYRASAEAIAEQVIADPAALQRVVGCAPSEGDRCAEAFIARFGRRAWRRPLSDAEQARYRGLFAQAPELVDGQGGAFEKGVRVVVEAMLQSPHFLYRVELDATSPGQSARPSGYTLASRLSFMLINEPPDDALLDAAERGALADDQTLAGEAERLLKSPAARATLRDFHRQWLELELLPNKLAKDTTHFPTVTPELAPVLQEESLRFAEAIAFEERRGFTSLLTAPFAFVNQITAPLYGLRAAAGDTLQRAPLDRAQRAGLFTQLAFLAGHAYTDQSSPIHRGVFVQRRVLCATIPDPPANVPSPPALGPTQTTRQQVDTLTSVSPCSSCHHTLINPVGFGFEHYDAAGQYRSEENGIAIDASGSLAGTRAAQQGGATFSDAIGASQRIAESFEGRRCYAATWLRYLMGRQENASEACMLDALADKLADDTYTATDLLVDLVRNPAFAARAGAEL